MKVLLLSTNRIENNFLLFELRCAIIPTEASYFMTVIMVVLHEKSGTTCLCSTCVLLSVLTTVRAGA